MSKLLNIKNFVIGILILVFAGLMFISRSTFMDGKKNAILLQDRDKNIVAQGKDVYGENCSSCHGTNLEGQPNWKKPDSNRLMPAPPHDQTGHTWHHTDDVLFGITKFGLAKFSGLKNYKTNMPVYENILSDDEIVAVLSFIKSTWPDEVKIRHNEMNSQDVGMK